MADKINFDDIVSDSNTQSINDITASKGGRPRTKDTTGLIKSKITSYLTATELEEFKSVLDGASASRAIRKMILKFISDSK